MSAKSANLIWETDLPLFSRAMFRQWTGAMLATLLVMALILTPMFAAQGEWDVLPPLIGVIAACIAGLWILGFVIMALVFRGKMRVRYTLSKRGVLYETVDKTAKGANRVAIVVGALARNPQALGSGLIARSRESEQVDWTQVARADYDPARSFITLRNSWRGIMWMQCTPENFAKVSAQVKQALAANRAAPATDSEASRPSPLPRYLIHSVLVLLAATSLFMLAEEFDLDLFVPLLVMCFALATLWLIPLFGWVVLAGLGWVGLELFLSLTEVRPSYIFPGRSHRTLDVLSDNDWGLLLLAALGTGYLVWLSVSAVRGRLLSMLSRDQG
jgi:hypothetical protein